MNIHALCGILINLPKHLSDSIELIQTRALKSIFPCMSYDDILNDTRLRTLKERRDVLCMKYDAEIKGSAHKLNGLLPALRKVDYDDDTRRNDNTPRSAHER